MEMSKTLQDNIRNVQNQMKLAIQNHQVILLKHQSNPSSGNVKVQLWEVQKHIISLGEAQKRLVQQLRKELEANSTNCTLRPTTVLPPKGPSPTPRQQSPVIGCRQPSPDRKTIFEEKSTTDRRLTPDKNPPFDPKPTSDRKLVTDGQPTIDKKPATDWQPTFVRKPSPDRKPTFDGKPIPGGKLEVERKPHVDEKPDVDAKPATDRKPLSDNQPVPYQQPSSDSGSVLPLDCCVEQRREQKCLLKRDVGCFASQQTEPPALARSPEQKNRLVVDTITFKLQFMSSLGLVTQEGLAELRNRRVERKRRSTANHVQFVYGKSWDACKRKKSNYLLTSSGVKLPAVPVSEVSPQENVSPLAPALRNASLPQSLTIQRITSSEPMCVVCRKTDNVQVCTKCSSSYHSTCISDGNCPRCCSPGANNTSSPTISEKMKQKLELLMKSNALCVEKSTLEQRKAQLVSAIQEQEAVHSELLKQQEEASVSIQRVHSFVQAFHKTPC